MSTIRKSPSYRLNLRDLRDAAASRDMNRLISERCKRKVMRTGHEVFAEGSPMTHIYFVYEGKVKIAHRTAQGRYLTTRIVGQGQCFGLRSYFTTSSTATVRAECLEPCVIYMMPVEVLNKLMAHSHEVSRLVISALSDELERIEERNVSLLTKHLRARLADVVLLLLEAYGVTEDGRTINLELRLSEVADLGNMTVANASRTMSEFVRSGILAKENRRIKILNRRKLELISQEKA